MVGRNAWCRKLWIPWLKIQTAKLCQRYDLTIVEFEPETRDIMEKIVPSLRHHALWLLGEAGKGKTPLGRVIAMMFSRYHGGQGTYRTTSDLDFFKGIPFAKKFPALFMEIQWRRGQEDQGFYRGQGRRANEASPLGEREVCPPPASCGPGQRIQSRCRARGQQK